MAQGKQTDLTITSGELTALLRAVMELLASGEFVIAEKPTVTHFPEMGYPHNVQ